MEFSSFDGNEMKRASSDADELHITVVGEVEE
jgi:hypothetical protein